MTREDIIRMAQEAISLKMEDHVWTMSTTHLERFAELVRVDERERIITKNAPEIERINAYIKELEKAVAAEREACAKLAEEPYEFTSEESHRIAAAIRARS